jgi:hypothetical protein
MSTLFRVPTVDGRYLYPLDGNQYLPRTSDLDLVRVGRTTFLVAPADASEVTYTTTSPGPVIGYRLTRAIPGAAETITLEQYQAHEDDDENDLDDLYGPIRGQEVTSAHIIDLTGYADLPVNPLDPAALTDPDPEYRWEPSLPYAIYGEAFATILPGTLTGIRGHIAEAVALRVPQATVYAHSAANSGVIEGSTTLDYEDQRTYPMKDGRRTRQVRSTKAFRFGFPIPNTVAGATKAEAVAEMMAIIDRITGQIDTTRPLVCAHCDGDGVVPSTDLPKPPPSRR